MRKPNWDTEAGREMWLEGKSDAQIADAFGISVYAVTNYRVKHWQKAPEQKNDTGRKSSFSLRQPVTAGEGVDPAILNKIRDNAEKAGIHLPGVKQEIAASAAPPRNDGAGAAAPDSPLAGMKVFDFERGLKPPIGEPEAVPVPIMEGGLESVSEDLTAERKDPEEAPVPMEERQAETPSRDTLDALMDAVKALKDLTKGQVVPSEPSAADTYSVGEGGLARTTNGRPYEANEDAGCKVDYTVPKPRLDEMDIMAAATEHLSGMQAVCTACAIQALWFWSGPADLRRAKKNIDWLLDHLEG